MSLLTQTKAAHVLLVEDSPVEVVLVENVLTNMDELDLLHVARDGVEALAYLKRQNGYELAKRPDLVLLDINMPKKNGFEVLQAMRADPQLRRIPTVMLTTSDDPRDIDRSYDLGASGYIVKPVGFDALENTLRTFADYWAGTVELPSDTFHLDASNGD